MLIWKIILFTLGIVNAVDNGTDIAAETAKSLAAIVESTAKSTELIEAIANASAEESAAASEEHSGQAQMLKGLVSRFKLNTQEQAADYSAFKPNKKALTASSIESSSEKY